MLEVFKNYLKRNMEGETLLSKERMDNLDECIQDVMKNDIPGDFIECGVWRGGACMLMRALLMEYGCKDRKVWVADSFQGCPRPDPQNYPLDGSCYPGTDGMLAVPLEVVRGNFQKYGLDDQQVVYWPGFFKDSLPACPIGKIAILRLDGDLYESTIQPLQYLYDKVSLGGWTIIDDYHHGPWAENATQDFLKSRGLEIQLSQTRDGTAAYWQKKE